MPIGEKFDETGLVFRNEWQRIGFKADDEGIWELDLLPYELWALGKRVRIRGVRSGFNKIEVHKIEPA